MKITILSAAYPYRGGLAHFTSLLYTELAKEHDVTVVTFKRQYPEFLFPGAFQKESDDKQLLKIPTWQLVDSLNPINWINAGIKIKKTRPDLLIINFWLPFFGPSFGTISRIVKSSRKTQVISICHNIFPHERRVFDKSFTKYYLNSVDSCVLLSHRLEQDLKMYKIDAVFKTLFHPVYSIFGEPVSKQEAKDFLKISGEKIILFFGHIREYKGLGNLLEAFAILKDKIDLKLIIAGEFYSDQDVYQKQIDELNLRDKIFLFNNFIPSSDVKYYFSAADAAILPYRNATQSGIVQIANNFLKPVIASDVGAMAESVLENKTGFLVVKNNPEKLAEAILRFYNEKKESEFAENIKSEIERLSWKNFVNGLMELFK